MTQDAIRNLTSDLISAFLWQLEAIQVSEEKPFQLTSGNFSPIYINCRLVMSHAPAMDLVTSIFHWLLREEDITTDVLAGGETAGIPFASYLAARLSLPMVYVRKRAKGHGLRTLVEGCVEPGMNVVLVEDLITDGQSKLDFVSSLRDAERIVEHCLVMFDRQQGGKEALGKAGVNLHALADVDRALRWGSMNSVIPSSLEERVRAYLADPKAWHHAHGLSYKEENQDVGP